MPSFNRCLRPTFTEKIIKSLEKGISINLVSQDGNGRYRLLEDIKNCTLPDHKIVIINLKSYKQNYKGMIDEICFQLEFSDNKPECFTDVFEKYHNQKEKVFLLLHNFDDLLNNPDTDPKFDKSFYNSLNFINKRHMISLLCVTRRPHNQSVVFIDGKDHSNSWLDLKKENLSRLNYKEIKAEIIRRVLPLSNYGISELAKIVLQSKQPYALLGFISDKIINREDESMEESLRFKKWTRKFFKEQKRRYFSPRGAHVFIRWFKNWTKILRIDKFFNSFNLMRIMDKLFNGIFSLIKRKRDE